MPMQVTSLNERLPAYLDHQAAPGHQESLQQQ